jgi:hypothetical protein
MLYPRGKTKMNKADSDLKDIKFNRIKQKKFYDGMLEFPKQMIRGCVIQWFNVCFSHFLPFYTELIVSSFVMPRWLP